MAHSRLRAAPAAIALLALLALPVFAEPRTGQLCRPQDYKAPTTWADRVDVHPRARLVVPVNVVRVFSDQNAGEKIAPTRWVYAQLDLANRLFRFKDEEMGAGGGPAACMQFQLAKIYDVHEKEVSEILGAELDTEKVFASNETVNGVHRVGTDDLRTLKVTGATDHLTIYCVHALMDPEHEVNEIGGEANVGFADRAPQGPPRTLTKVTSTRARMGVVVSRAEATWMNTVAHELGHYFGLPHAWMREWNTRIGLTDLGEGPQGSVDGRPGFANVMDYASGEGVTEYFTRSQLDYMFRFAKEKASSQVRVIVRDDGDPPPADVAPTAVLADFRIDAPADGGDVVVRTKIDAKGLSGRPVNVVAWFSDASGQALQDTDGQYRSIANQVAVGAEITPDRSPAALEVNLVLPAGQLHLPPGKSKVTVVVGAFSGGTSLLTSDPKAFEYMTPGEVHDPEGGAAARITETKVEAPVEDEDREWVRIITNLEIDNLLDREVFLEARFTFSDGTPLRDFNGEYATSDGLAYAANKIVPIYENTIVTGMEVWIPVDELHLADGRHAMVAGLTVVHAGKALASATTEAFYLTIGSAPPVAPPAPPAGVRVDSTWVTHNHWNGVEYGMVFHADCTVTGLMGRPLVAAAWYWGYRGEPLRDFDGVFRGANGQVSSWVNLTPIYDSARFPDLQIFIPYSQLHLAPGVHDLGVTMGVYEGDRPVGGTSTTTPFRVVWR